MASDRYAAITRALAPDYEPRYRPTIPTVDEPRIRQMTPRQQVEMDTLSREQMMYDEMNKIVTGLISDPAFINAPVQYKAQMVDAWERDVLPGLQSTVSDPVQQELMRDLTVYRLRDYVAQEERSIRDAESLQDDALARGFRTLAQAPNNFERLIGATRQQDLAGTISSFTSPPVVDSPTTPGNYWQRLAQGPQEAILARSPEARAAAIAAQEARLADVQAALVEDEAQAQAFRDREAALYNNLVLNNARALDNERQRAFNLAMGGTGDDWELAMSLPRGRAIGSLASSFLENAPNTLASIGAGAAAGAVTGGAALPAVLAAGTLGAGLGAAQGFEELTSRVASLPQDELLSMPGYQGYLAQGMSPEQARARMAADVGADFAPVMGLIEGAGSALGLEGLIVGNPMMRNLAAKYGTRFITRAAGMTALGSTTEGLEEVGQNAVANYATGQPLMEGAGGNFALGAVASLPFAGFGGVTQAMNLETQAQAQAALEQAALAEQARVEAEQATATQAATEQQAVQTQEAGRQAELFARLFPDLVPANNTQLQSQLSTAEATRQTLLDQVEFALNNYGDDVAAQVQSRIALQLQEAERNILSLQSQLYGIPSPSVIETSPGEYSLPNGRRVAEGNITILARKNPGATIQLPNGSIMTIEDWFRSRPLTPSSQEVGPPPVNISNINPNPEVLPAAPLQGTTAGPQVQTATVSNPTTVNEGTPFQTTIQTPETRAAQQTASRMREAGYAPAPAADASLLLHNMLGSLAEINGSNAESFITSNVAFEALPDVPRGATVADSSGVYTVLFGNNADASTALHEFEHIFVLEALRTAALPSDQVTDTAAQAQLQSDLALLNRWAGGRDGAWTPSVHERAARGFEAYVRTGRAPNGRLAAVFERMKKLLTAIYNSLRNLNVGEMSDDVRNVFDRQLTGYRRGDANTTGRTETGGSDTGTGISMENAAQNTVTEVEPGVAGEVGGTGTAVEVGGIGGEGGQDAGPVAENDGNNPAVEPSVQEPATGPGGGPTGAVGDGVNNDTGAERLDERQPVTDAVPTENGADVVAEWEARLEAEGLGVIGGERETRKQKARREAQPYINNEPSETVVEETDPVPSEDKETREAPLLEDISGAVQPASRFFVSEIPGISIVDEILGLSGDGILATGAGLYDEALPPANANPTEIAQYNRPYTTAVMDALSNPQDILRRNVLSSGFWGPIQERLLNNGVAVAMDRLTPVAMPDEVEVSGLDAEGIAELVRRVPKWNGESALLYDRDTNKSYVIRDDGSVTNAVVYPGVSYNNGQLLRGTAMSKTKVTTPDGDFKFLEVGRGDFNNGIVTSSTYAGEAVSVPTEGLEEELATLEQSMEETKELIQNAEPDEKSPLRVRLRNLARRRAKVMEYLDDPVLGARLESFKGLVLTIGSATNITGNEEATQVFFQGNLPEEDSIYETPGVEDDAIAVRIQETHGRRNDPNLYDEKLYDPSGGFMGHSQGQDIAALARALLAEAAPKTDMISIIQEFLSESAPVAVGANATPVSGGALPVINDVAEEFLKTPIVPIAPNDMSADQRTNHVGNMEEWKAKAIAFRAWAEDHQAPVRNWFINALGGTDRDVAVNRAMSLAPERVRRSLSTMLDEYYAPVMRFSYDQAREHKVGTEDLVNRLETAATAYHIIQEGAAAHDQMLVEEINRLKAEAEPNQARVIQAEQALANYRAYQDDASAKKVPVPGGLRLEDRVKQWNDAVAWFGSEDTLLEGVRSVVRAYQGVLQERLANNTLTQEEFDQINRFKWYVSTATPQEANMAPANDADSFFLNARRQDFRRMGSLAAADGSIRLLLKAIERTATEIGMNAFVSEVAGVHNHLAQQEGGTHGLRMFSEKTLRRMSSSENIAENQYARQIRESGGLIYRYLNNDGQRETYRIIFEGNDQGFTDEDAGRLNKALGLLTKQSDILATVAGVTRTMSQFYTLWRPMFAPINAARDLPERMFTTLGSDFKKADGTRVTGSRVMATMAGMAMNPLYMWEYGKAFLGKGVGPIGRMYEEFKRAGGNYSYSQYLNQGRNSFEAIIKKQGSKLVAAKNVITKWSDFFNSFPAFLQYAAFRENGVSASDSSAYTLDTMNFHKNGTSTPVLSAWAPFVVSTVQTGANLMRVLTQGGNGSRAARNRAWATLGGLVMAGSMLISSLRAGADDDESGQNRYDLLSFDQLSRGIPLIGDDGSVVHVPIGFGGPMLAWITANVIQRLNDGLIDPTEAAYQMTFATLRTMTPGSMPSYAFGDNPSAWLLQFITPHIIRPLSDMAVNRNNWGTPITSTQFKQIGQRDYEMGRSSTPAIYHEWAKTIYDILGLDFAPESIRYSLGFYLPGMLQSGLIALEQNDINSDMHKNTRASLGPIMSGLGAGSLFSAPMNAAQSAYYTRKEQIERQLNDKGVRISKAEKNLENNRLLMRRAGFDGETINDYMKLLQLEKELQTLDRQFKKDNYGIWWQQGPDQAKRKFSSWAEARNKVMNARMSEIGQR